jgi:hypothetical protein
MKSPLQSPRESRFFRNATFLAPSRATAVSQRGAVKRNGTRDASSLTNRFQNARALSGMYLWYRNRWQTHIFPGHCCAGMFDWNPCVSVITEASAS